MPLYVGTSGWQYPHWRGVFYPDDVPRRAWLDYYMTRFAALEVNNAFYRLPDRSVFENWQQHIPPGFLVAVKASRYLTHVRRLVEPAEPVRRLAERVAGLGDRLGPVLLQLPPTLRADAERLARCLESFPTGVRVAVEPRHDSWWCPPVRRVLERFGAALCWADRRSRPVTPLWRTAGWGYLRLHEGRATPWPRYGTGALHAWVQRLVDTFSADEDVFVFFNNDPDGAAVRDATTFVRFAAAAGREPVGPPGDVQPRGSDRVRPGRSQPAKPGRRAGRRQVSRSTP